MAKAKAKDNKVAVELSKAEVKELFDVKETKNIKIQMDTLVIEISTGGIK